MENSDSIFSITQAILAIVFSYLIGSIPVGFIVAQIAKGIDIREHGSGNIGLTNVIRVLGWGPGIITGVLDFLKGYLPVFFVMSFFDSQTFGISAIYETIVIMVAATLVIGNLYPVYLLFKGGKGVATGLGVMTALLGVFILIPLAVFGLFLFISRYVSLASILAAISVPLTVLVLSSRISFVNMTEESGSAFAILSIFTWAAAILISWSHRENIARIFAGTELQVGKSEDSKKKSELIKSEEKVSGEKEAEEQEKIEDSPEKEKQELTENESDS